jgi:hypothetical protein
MPRTKSAAKAFARSRCKGHLTKSVRGGLGLFKPLPPPKSKRRNQQRKLTKQPGPAIVHSPAPAARPGPPPLAAFLTSQQLAPSGQSEQRPSSEGMLANQRGH